MRSAISTSRIAHVRQACQAPRALRRHFSDLAEMCRQSGLLAEGEAGGAPRGRARAELRRRLEQSRHHPAGGAQARRKPALSRTGDGARADNPQTLNNLANTFKRLGLAAEAEKRWSAALELKPDYAEAYSNLSNLLLDQGEYDRAEKHGAEAPSSSVRGSPTPTLISPQSRRAPSPRRGVQRARRAARLRARALRGRSPPKR